METIRLTDGQRAVIVSRLKGITDDGEFSLEIPVADDILVFANGKIITDGYREDDYINGTGAWIETQRETWVSLTACVGKDDCTLYNVDATTEQAAEKALCP